MNIKQYIKHTLLASALLASSIFGYQKPTYADISEDMPNSDSQKTLSQKELHVLSVFAERITQLVTTQRINQSSYDEAAGSIRAATSGRFLFSHRRVRTHWR